VTEQQEVQMLARLSALEILVQHLVWIVHGKSVLAVQTYAETLDRSLATAHVPTVNPALSDHMSAEIQEQTSRILRELIERAEAAESTKPHL
jgi:hypothetical protein